MEQSVIRLVTSATVDRLTAIAAYLSIVVAMSEPLAAVEPPGLPNSTMRLEVDSIGKRRIQLKPGHRGLTYFPDEGISVLSRKPLTFLMVAGKETWLMRGKSWSSAVPVTKVIEPSPDGPDSGYAGVGAVHIDTASRTVYAFYHAEDHQGYQKLKYNGVQNFMASVCLAVGPLDGGKRIEKRGQVLTTHQAKNFQATQPQGVADVTVNRSPDGQYLYAWYTDHSRENNRGVQICMARAPISEHGKPGTWTKWYEGGFREPGLGGRETPVMSVSELGADAFAPNVAWVSEYHSYVMVFNVVVYDDFKQEAQPAGGIRLAYSVDGIHWSQPQVLVKAMAVPVPGKRCAMHPTFVTMHATGRVIRGTLLYGYSPKWGHTVGAPSHHLASRSIQLKVSSD